MVASLAIVRKAHVDGPCGLPLDLSGFLFSSCRSEVLFFFFFVVFLGVDVKSFSFSLSSLQCAVVFGLGPGADVGFSRSKIFMSLAARFFFSPWI